MGNEGIYSVGKKFGKANKLFAKQMVSRVLRVMALNCETLAKFTTWHDSSASTHVLHTWPF